MSKIQLRPYQKQAVSMIEGSITMGDTEICLSACTSYGKTFTLMQFIKDEINNGKSIVFMMNLTALIEQTIEAAKAMNISYKVIAAEFDGQEFDHQANLTICMQQTLYARIDKIEIDCDILIIDEFHRSFRTPTMEDVKNKLDPNIILGCSGSVMDEKGYALPHVEVIETKTIKELTDEKFLTPLKVYSVEFAEEIDYTDGGAGEYSENFLNGKINNDPYNSNVVKAWLQVAKGKKTIVFATGIDHAESLTRNFTQNGVKALSFHSGLSKNDSKANMKSFKQKDGTEVLVSVSSILVGFDYPGIECIVACRPTKTRRVWLQAVGRGIRLFPGKEECILLDCATWTREHGFIEEPYDPPKKGDKQAMKQLQEKVQAPVIPTILNGDAPTEITRELVIKKIKELEFKAKNVPQLNLADLITLHATSRDPQKIIEIAYEMNRRKTGSPYTMNSVKWVAGPWYKMIDDFSEYTDRLLKTIRSMSKKKVVQGKKLNALHYTVLEDGWLRDQQPYCYSKQDNFKNEDEEEEAYNAYAEYGLTDQEIPF